MEEFMRIEELDYTIPANLIAREPREINGLKKSDSKLLVFDRKNNKIYHKHFMDIIDYFERGDVLVLNNSKTINARLIGYYNNVRIEFCIYQINENNECTCYFLNDKFLAINNKITIYFSTSIFR